MEVTAFAAHPSARLLLTIHCDQYCLMVLLTLWKLHHGRSAECCQGAVKISTSSENFKRCWRNNAPKQIMQQVSFYCCICGSFQEAKLFVSRLPSKLLSSGEMRETKSLQQCKMACYRWDMDNMYTLLQHTA